VFYDPRSLEMGRGPRVALHAKCIIADEVAALVTSANFTEAAQERNIEAGVLFRDEPVVRALKRQFDSLLDHGWFKSLPQGS
jgi:phosphatidylserine/phosphatidylglycerophosphate/cardiolipin synthase-like enzyme